MNSAGKNFGPVTRATAQPKARTRAIAVNSDTASAASYIALTFLMSAMFVFMLMMGWAAGV